MLYLVAVFLGRYIWRVFMQRAQKKLLMGRKNKKTVNIQGVGTR